MSKAILEFDLSEPEDYTDFQLISNMSNIRSFMFELTSGNLKKKLIHKLEVVEEVNSIDEVFSEIVRELEDCQISHLNF